jgi:hypothetical protein
VLLPRRWYALNPVARFIAALIICFIYLFKTNQSDHFNQPNSIFFILFFSSSSSNNKILMKMMEHIQMVLFHPINHIPEQYKQSMHELHQLI